MFLSKRSPPLGFIVAATDRPPRLYVSRYSPPDCFCGRPASMKRNSPQLPGNFKVEEPESLAVLGLLVVVTFEFVEFAVAGGAEDVVPPTDAKFICTPVSAAPAAGNDPLIEPVPSDVIFWPSIETSISASFDGRRLNSYSNFGVGLVPNNALRSAMALFR